MVTVHVRVLLFLAVISLRGGSTLEEQRPAMDLLLDVLSAMNTALDFMGKQKAHLNVDGVVGPRMVSDQLRVLLDHQGDILNKSSTWTNLLANLDSLRQKAKGIADDAVAFVRISQPSYYNSVGNAMRAGLWALDYPVRFPSESRPRNKGTALRPVLPVNINECLNEFLGSSESWPPPCNISRSCWASVILPEMTSYPLTHQIIYLELANMSGCGNQLDRMSSGNTTRILDTLCDKVLTEAEGIESHGYPEFYQDLFAEQIAVCGFLGNKEFFSETWVRSILSWQDFSGCYKIKKENRVKREDVMLEGGCSSHQTSVTLGALVASARFLLEEILHGANEAF